MVASAPSASSFPFFVPQASQDAELLQQLGFLPGLKEALMVRQVHALEHATVWVLSESQSLWRGENLSGLSTPEGFYLYGEVHPAQIQQAVKSALHRLTNGEWNLAVHPRCGTNLSVGMMLTAGLATGTLMMMPKGWIEQLLGVGLAATLATQLTPELGSLVQRYVTTAIPFNLQVTGVRSQREEARSGDLQQRGTPVHFVSVAWRDA